MQKRKPRILWVNEYSQMNTGFSVYGNEVLKRIHATGKYQLAELASYVAADHPSIRDMPWKVFPVAPVQGDEAAEAEFRSNNNNQFGKWKLEDACLNFRPDIIVDIRDLWMSTFIDESIFRHNFKFYYMPTVDAVPQRDNWLQVMQNCDKIFAYTDWGLEVIKSQSYGQVNTICSTPPGADFSVFKPMDKNAIRKEFGIVGDVNIIGFLSRNQSRKLIPDLIVSFKHFISYCLNSKEEKLNKIGRKTYLLLHTSYPDVGWNIPELIKNSGVGERILLTYTCIHCGYYAPQFFKDAACHCPKCNELAFKLTNTHNGVSREALAKLLNICDCYMQYSNSEGFGMGAVEAAACGVPVFATDYSAMADVVRHTNGYPLKVKTLIKEPETGCMRAQPDFEDTVVKWLEFFKKPETQRGEESVEVAKSTRIYYDYDNTARSWMTEFDKEPLREWSQTWENPRPDLRNPMQNLPAPQILNPVDFVKWCAANILGRPLRDHQVLKLAKTIMYGQYIEGKDVTFLMNDNSILGRKLDTGAKFTRENCIQAMMIMRDKMNEWEEARIRMIGKFQEPTNG